MLGNSWWYSGTIIKQKKSFVVWQVLMLEDLHIGLSENDRTPLNLMIIHHMFFFDWVYSQSHFWGIHHFQKHLSKWCPYDLQLLLQRFCFVCRSWCLPPNSSSRLTPWNRIWDTQSMAELGAARGAKSMFFGAGRSASEAYKRGIRSANL